MINPADLADKFERQKYYQIWAAVNCEHDESEMDFNLLLWLSEKVMGIMLQEDQQRRTDLQRARTSNEELVKLGLYEGADKLENKYVNRWSDRFCQILEELLNVKNYKKPIANTIPMSLTVAQCKGIEKNYLTKILRDSAA